MTAATPAQAPLRIVLAEDSPLLRAGVEAVLARGGHEVVAAVGDGAALVDAVRAAQRFFGTIAEEDQNVRQPQ